MLLKKLAKYRFVAKDYLQYGHMLRPIVFENKLPDVIYSGWERIKGYRSVIRRPAIMSSFWESPDGSLGLVLFDISGNPQLYHFKLSPDRYPQLGRAVKLYQLSLDGTEAFLDQMSSSDLVLKGKLIADEVRMLVLRQALESGDTDQ